MKSTWFYVLICYLKPAIALETRIFKGSDAQPGQFPYVVFLSDGTSGCTGALISPTWVLTAGHCIKSLPVVVAGDPDRKSAGVQKRKASRTVVHSGYAESIGRHDVALVEVSQPFDISGDNIGILELDGNGWPQDRQLNVPCISVGYGTTERERSPQRLQWLSVTGRHGIGAIPCYHQRFLEKRVVCLGPQDGGVCMGDSGGPLVCGGKGVGVAHLLFNKKQCSATSTKPVKVECGTEDTAVVYMFVCPYLSWIKSFVEEVPPTPESCKAHASYSSSLLLLSLTALLYLLIYSLNK